MEDNPSNSGIVQYGGSISAGNLAVGTGATIVLSDVIQGLEERGMDEIALRLKELTQALVRDRSSIEDYAKVGGATSRLGVELNQKTPDRRRVLQLLAVIAKGAGTVASVSTAVESLRAAVTAIV